MSAWPKISANGRGRRLTVVAILALLQAIAAGVSAIAMRETFAALGNPGQGSLPVLSVAVITAAAALLALFRWQERVLAEQIGQEFAGSLRLQLFKHIARLPADELAKRRVGGLSLRFVGDLTAIREWVSRGITRLLSAAIVIPVVWFVLVHINAELAMAALPPIMVGLILMALAGLPLMAAHRRLRSRRSRLSAGVTERLPHASELRLLGRLSKESTQIRRNTEHMIAAALERQRLPVLIRVVPDIMAGIALAAMLWVALSKPVPAAETAGAIAAMGMMVQKMRELGSVWNRYCAWNTAKKRCMALLSVRPLPQKRRQPGNRSEKQFTAQMSPGVHIRLAQVQLDDQICVDARVSPGEKIGLIGPNGCGKSRLLQLIAGMQRPAAGSIRIDGEQAISWAGVSAKRVLYLGPHSPILAGSLRRSLTLGLARRPKDSVIEETAALYGLTAVIRRLGGIEGRIAENGRNLSAGELRRILLARAALLQPDLLLLDDPAASLDAEGKQLVRQLIEAIPGTVLITAPEKNQLPRVDTLWQLENGAFTVEDMRIPTRRPLALLISPSQKPDLCPELPDHSYAAALGGAALYSLN